MSFEQEGIPITAAQKDVDFALNLATLSEQIRKGIHNREVLSHPSLPTRIELAALRGANRLLNPILELGIRRDGRVAALPPATIEDAQGAVDVLFGATQKTPEEFYRHYKLYVQKVPTKERDILLCTCAPRGAEAAGDLMFGNHRKSGLERVGEVVALELTAGQRKKLGIVARERFLSPETAAEVYERISSERIQLTKDSQKPVVVFQGLHPSYALKGVSPHDRVRLGLQIDGERADVVAVYESLDPKFLAHEYAHLFHDSVAGRGGNLFFQEGDALLAEKEFDVQFNIRKSMRLTLQGIKGRAEYYGSMDEAVDTILYVNHSNMQKGKQQNYYETAVLGYLAAEQIVEHYGREFWNQFFISMNYNAENYEEFLIRDGAAFTYKGITMSYQELRGMLVRRLEQLV